MNRYSYWFNLKTAFIADFSPCLALLLDFTKDNPQKTNLNFYQHWNGKTLYANLRTTLPITDELKPYRIKNKPRETELIAEDVLAQWKEALNI